jgi:hypothetical protein
MKWVVVMIACVCCFALAASCEKKAETEETSVPQPEAAPLSFVSDEISFAIYFDEAHTRRAIDLAKGQTEIDIYVVIHFPEEMGIAAAEYRIELPDGAKILSDSFYENRTLTMGNFQDGFSEGFHCVHGPKLQLHKLGLSVQEGMKDATIALLPSKRTDFLGVATCGEGFPEVRASSYKAVINPSE